MQAWIVIALCVLCIGVFAAKVIQSLLRLFR